MSTAVGSGFSHIPRPPRVLPRFHVALPLDVTVLRAGIPDRIPARSVDISNRGLGVVVAGELFVGESVALEFWLPRLEEPLKARAVVRHQHQLRCGLEFQGLSTEQQAVIQRWTQRKSGIALSPGAAAPWARTVPKQAAPERVPLKQRRKQLQRELRRWGLRIAPLIVLAAGLGWWRWQRGWTEIEAQLPAQAAVPQPELIVASTEMEQHITHKVDPVYPEAARQAHVHGTVMLRAIIGADGTVVKLENIGGPEILAQAAMDAARWWRYEPYLMNGRPVEVETTLQIPFSEYRVSTTN